MSTENELMYFKVFNGRGGGIPVVTTKIISSTSFLPKSISSSCMNDKVQFFFFPNVSYAIFVNTLIIAFAMSDSDFTGLFLKLRQRVRVPEKVQDWYYWFPTTTLILCALLSKWFIFQHDEFSILMRNSNRQVINIKISVVIISSWVAQLKLSVCEAGYFSNAVITFLLRLLLFTQHTSLGLLISPSPVSEHWCVELLLAAIRNHISSRC